MKKMETIEGAKILLIDDDVDFVQMNKVVLEKAGCLVLAAHTVAAGQELAARDKPDLIVLDVMMATPTDGFHLAQALRKDPATREIPIIMLTSVNQTVPYKFEPDQAWLPVDQFLEKPVKPERLLAEIRKRLGIGD